MEEEEAAYTQEWAEGLQQCVLHLTYPGLLCSGAMQRSRTPGNNHAWLLRGRQAACNEAHSSAQPCCLHVVCPSASSVQAR